MLEGKYKSITEIRVANMLNVRFPCHPRVVPYLFIVTLVPETTQQLSNHPEILSKSPSISSAPSMGESRYRSIAVLPLYRDHS